MCKLSTIFITAFLMHYLIITAHAKPENSLTARDLLETIAPTYQQTKLPPGFPSLSSIKTDKFDYETGGNVIKVSAKLEKPVIMFPDYVIISNVKLNFTFNKTSSSKRKIWNVDVKGSWSIGSTILHVNITPAGKISSKVDTLELREIVNEFMKEDSKKDIGIDISSLTLKNVTIKADIASHNGMTINFFGKLDHASLDPIPIQITIDKFGDAKTRLFSILQFKKIRPEKVLKKILNQKTLNIPFFAHMMSDSNLFLKKKDVFGLAFSFTEVYYVKENSIPGEILTSVLQSHIPIGVTLLFPLNLSETKLNTLSNSVKIAFVINKPAFDLLIDQKDKISIQQILPVLSREFETSTTNTVPNFVTDLNDAYTTHVSFDSTSTMFSIFVRLEKTLELIKDLLKIRATHLVLQRNIGLDDKKEEWKIAAKGSYKIGTAKVNVQYSELSDEDEKPFGLTGYAKEVSLEDIMSEYDPDFFPDEQSQQMIENTEIGSIKIHKVRLYSRVPRKTGTPHVLITGFTNLPQWEKDIQMAILMLFKNGTWECKWAASLKHSPLSNVIQAFTGFDSKDLKILHNGHILTTIISSPLPSYSLLPPHIITTPLLRLPVKKALTVVALLRFPDNCGDDKICEAASTILDTAKVYTVKGVVSLDSFELKAKITDDIEISDSIKGVNSSLQFTIGNTSRLDILTSIELPMSKLIFDGLIQVNKTGKLKLQMNCRRKQWNAPFDLKSISFTEIQLNSFYTSSEDLNIIPLTGKVLLGAHGSRQEISASLKLDYDPFSPKMSTFSANFSDINLEELLQAFSLDTQLPSVLKKSDFPNGLILTYSGKIDRSNFQLHGDVQIFGRLLKCSVRIKHPGYIEIVTQNSPAPVIFAKGQIIIQQDSKKVLRGPIIVAKINRKKANVNVKGLVKILGIEDETDIALEDDGVKFSVTGKLMEYKSTTLNAYSLGSTDSFQVQGCFQDLTTQVQILLENTLTKAANQSIFSMEKADANYMSAQKHFNIADREEVEIRGQRDKARSYYEEHLLAYGRYEIKANDTCVAPKCNLKCFGCPKLNKCCRLDIFGHCIACSTWKTCCWKNLDPLCISKHDGCQVIKTVAERDLTEKEALLIEQRIILDNLEQHVVKAEINKGKHQAVLEAAIDAKQIIEDDSSPGLNAFDTIRNFGSNFGWANINSICYNTSIEQASTGCMNFHIASQFFDFPPQTITIWSCLKEDLVTEITESIANYLFPKIIDTTSDNVEVVAEKLNTEKLDSKLAQLGGGSQVEEQNKNIGENSNESDSEKEDQNNESNTEKEEQSEEADNPSQGVVYEKYPNTMKIPANPKLDTQQQEIQGVDSNTPNDYPQSGTYGVTESPNQNISDNPQTSSANNNMTPKLPSQGASNLPQLPSENSNNENPQMPSSNTNNGTTSPIAEQPVNETADEGMLDEALEEAAEGNNGSNNNDADNGNSPSTPTSQSGSPQDDSMNTPKLPAAQPNTEQPIKPISESDEVDEDDSKEQSVSGEEEVNKELSQLYDIGTSGEGEEPKKSKSNKRKDKNAEKYVKGKESKNVKLKETDEEKADDEKLIEEELRADQLVGQEEIDEEEEFKNTSNKKNKKQKAKKQNNHNNKKKIKEAKKVNLNLSYSNQQMTNATNTTQPSNTEAYYNKYYSSKEYRDWYNRNQAITKISQPLYAKNYQYINNVIPTTKYRAPIKVNVTREISRKRTRRNIDDVIRSRVPLTMEKPSNKILFSNPFWNIVSDRTSTSARSTIPRGNQHRQKLMKNVIQKRWTIPDNSNGRCHVFHQLLAICKDMAETIMMLDKTLKDSLQRFHDEDKDIYIELFDTEKFLVDSAKRVNVSGYLLIDAGKTLNVVRQGVNIWSHRCSNEFAWQDQSGVQTWLQAMDIRIQELGGYGVYRFLENLFHAFEALFEALTYSNTSSAKDALRTLKRIHHIAESFDKIFRKKLSVTNSKHHANNILSELGNLRKDTMFC